MHSATFCRLPIAWNPRNCSLPSSMHGWAAKLEKKSKVKRLVRWNTMHRIGSLTLYHALTETNALFSGLCPSHKRSQGVSQASCLPKFVAYLVNFVLREVVFTPNTVARLVKNIWPLLKFLAGYAAGLCRTSYATKRSQASWVGHLHNPNGLQN